ncbi:WD40/YVTN/BNR-like repeat-containing protein [Desulfolutivibrio sp.]|uniref:WD40/YVTN/BNR-like repeat-containing protein n=1 Tax=Desulfolutivibrio sp. TaxID=2773296 RepID=UPI002F96A103
MPMSFLVRNVSRITPLPVGVLVILLLSVPLFGCGSDQAPSTALQNGPQLAKNDAESDTERLARLLQKKRAKPPKRFDKPKEAMVFFAERRAPVGETAIPVERYVAALEHMKGMDVYSTKLNRRIPAARKGDFLNSREGVLGRWTAVGPGNVGGRIRSLVIDPGTPATMYAGGVAGGVWKTVDSGTTWTPLTDLLPNLAVCSLAMDPKNSAILYAGTGEGFGNSDAVRGAGIFKTTSAGASWALLPATATEAFYYVNDIVTSPNDSNRVYAATRQGLYLSADAGTSWTQVHDASAISGCTDLAVSDNAGTDRVFAACGMWTTSPTAYILRSTNNGQNWSQVYTQAYMDRTSLAIAPSNPDIIYALASNNNTTTGYLYTNGLLAVLKSIDGGTTWNAVYTNTNDCTVPADMLLTNPQSAMCPCTTNPNNFANQGWYDNVIAVDPKNPNIVWAGGIDLFRSDNGGQTWGMASYWWTKTTRPYYNHADHHVLVFHPAYDGAANQTLYSGNDGGLAVTANARAGVTQTVCDTTSPPQVAWTSLNNGLSVTQYYYGAVYPGGGTFFGGAQDNGTTRGTTAAGPNAWTTLLGGDGGAVAVNPDDTNILYGEYTNLSMVRSTDGGANFEDCVSGITEKASDFPFITVFAMDPGNPDILWTGNKHPWRTENGATLWTKAGTKLPDESSISAMTVAPGNSNLAAIGTSKGHILITTNALSATSATVWTHTKPVSGNISSVAFDPTNTQTLYATCSNFGQHHVVKSVNGGATWADISGSGTLGLPDVPTFALIVDPNAPSRLYVGTDLGVFVTTNGGASWAVENTGFANVITESLVRDAQSGRLFAFTHGRGVWNVPLPGSAASVPAVAPLLLGDQ